LQPRENNFGAFAMDAFALPALLPANHGCYHSSNLRGECLQPAATSQWSALLVLLPRRHPSSGSTGGISEYATQSCDHYLEESISQSATSFSSTMRAITKHCEEEITGAHASKWRDTAPARNFGNRAGAVRHPPRPAARGLRQPIDSEQLRVCATSFRLSIRRH